MTDDADFVIELDGIGKAFGGVPALTDVSLRLRRGTVHAFVGENGAGKSTLGKIISGTFPPTEGSMRVDGEPVVFSTPRDALDRGIATIQQEIALVPGRTVLENVFLGREKSVLGFVSERSLRAEYEDLVAKTGFRIRPDTLVQSLRIADQQKVEVLRAVARRARVIVFDEPTAALTPDETATLLSVVKSLRSQGVTIVYVSHFLEEVLSLADDITVLRNGRRIRTGSAAGDTPASLIESMLGRTQEQLFPNRADEARRAVAPVLEVEHLSRSGALSDVSFSVRPGEIVGVSGLVGSGRTELLRAIFGADPLDSGTIRVAGVTQSALSPRRSVRSRLALVPEDRKGEGLAVGRSVTENTTLVHLRNVSRLSFVQRRRERPAVRAIMERLNVQPRRPALDVGRMSGGNQQKVMFARWLIGDPDILLIDEPTRGVDVGAKFAIYQTLFELADAGKALVVVSSEVEEILGLADRVLVMRRGRLVLDAPKDDLDEEEIMRHAFGTADAVSAGGMAPR